MENNPFKLKFTLKQHTPLIHFQHEQQGATLRATELKPKLDKLIISSFKFDNKEIPKSWFVGNGKSNHPALDYKIKIRSRFEKDFWLFSYVNRKVLDEIHKSTGTEAISNSAFFADASHLDSRNLHKSKWDEMSKGLLYENVQAEIFSLKTELIDVVKSYFPVLIATNNFGTRQSKGFGSFEVTHLNNEIFKKEFLSLAEKDKSVKAVFFSADFSNDDHEKLQNIAVQYQLLKSGINRPNPHGKGTYAKSLLFQFLSKDEIRWEKRWIKRNIDKAGKEPQLKYDIAPIDYDGYNDWNDEEQREYRYARALLGLAEHNEYLKTEKGKFQIKIEDASGDIERFRSPITFKIQDGGCYVLVNEIPLEIRDSYFKFTFFDKPPNGDAYKIAEFNPTLKPPSEDEFNLIEFLDWAFELMNNVKRRQDPREGRFKDDLWRFAFSYTKKYQQ